MSSIFPHIPEKIRKIFELNFVDWTQEQLNDVARHSELSNLPPINLEILEKDFPNLNEESSDDELDLQPMHMLAQEEAQDDTQIEDTTKNEEQEIKKQKESDMDTKEENLGKDSLETETEDRQHLAQKMTDLKRAQTENDVS